MHETIAGVFKINSFNFDFSFLRNQFFLFYSGHKRMDVSIAYAIWAGLGTALITVVGIFESPEQ